MYPILDRCKRYGEAYGDTARGCMANAGGGMTPLYPLKAFMQRL
jgi:hypothetical protein